MMVARAFVRFHALVEPRRVVVLFLLRIPTGKKSAQILRILERFGNDYRRVRVMHHVLAEIQVVLKNVVDQPPKEKNVGAGPQGNPCIRNGGSAAKSWIHMNQVRAVLFFRFDDPLEADGRSEEHTSELQ